MIDINRADYAGDAGRARRTSGKAPACSYRNARAVLALDEPCATALATSPDLVEMVWYYVVDFSAPARLPSGGGRTSPRGRRTNP